MESKAVAQSKGRTYLGFLAKLVDVRRIDDNPAREIDVRAVVATEDYCWSFLHSAEIDMLSICED